jgi:hypothetical protein
VKRDTVIAAAVVAAFLVGLFAFLHLRHESQAQVDVRCVGAAAELGQVQRELDELDAKSSKLYRRKMELLKQLGAAKP